MINSYKFGEICVRKKHYREDVLILPRKVESWWRKNSHSVEVEDLDEILKAKPKTVIIGTGYTACMGVPTEVREKLKSAKIKLIVEGTGKACETYNKIKDKKGVVFAVHLTC